MIRTASSALLRQKKRGGRGDGDNRDDSSAMTEKVDTFGPSEGFPSSDMGKEGSSEWRPASTPDTPWKPDEFSNSSGSSVSPQSVTPTPTSDAPVLSGGDILGSGSDASVGFSGDAASDVGASLDGAGATDAEAVSETLLQGWRVAPGTLSPEDLGLWPNQIFISAMEHMHQMAGMPYWATVIAVTVLARASTFPITVGALVHGARLAMAMPELNGVKRKMGDTKEIFRSGTEAQKQAAIEKSQEAQREMIDIFAKHQANPMRIYMVFLQAPILMGLFIATQQMGGYFPDYTVGGLSFALDLSRPDPTYVFPCILFASLQLLCQLGPATPMEKTPVIDFKTMMRIFSLLSIPLSIQMPVGTVMYMTASNLMTFAQRAFYVDRLSVKERLGMPTTEDIKQQQRKYAEIEAREGGPAPNGWFWKTDQGDRENDIIKQRDEARASFARKWREISSSSKHKTEEMKNSKSQTEKPRESDRWDGK